MAKVERSSRSQNEVFHHEAASTDEKFRLKEKIGLAGGVAFITGTMVGSGIFASPVGVLVGVNGSIGMSLVMWAACGLIATLGGLCYCELGAAIHESGSEYAYLNCEYGPVVAFIFSWTSSILSRAAGNAAIAVTLGSYLTEPFYAGDCAPPSVVVKLAAALGVIFLTCVNYVSVKASSKLQSVLTLAKFAVMLVIVVGGVVRLVQGDPVGVSNLRNAFRADQLNGLGFTQIGLAFYQGLWSYDGWNTLNYITEEVKDSSRTLPRAIIIAVPLVTCFYLLVNLSYFAVLYPEEMLNSNAVAVTWGYRVLGSFGWIMPLGVCLSTLGSMNGSFLTGGRVPFVAARRQHLPQILAMVHVEYLTPGPSLIYSCGLTLIFLIPNDFDQLVNAFSFTAWLFYGLAIGGVVLLRFTRPDMQRPYKVPLLIPMIMTLIAAYLVVAPLVDNPDVIIAAAAGFMLCGPFVYFLFVYKKFALPGMDMMTTIVQEVLDVAPSDWDDVMSTDVMTTYGEQTKRSLL